MTKTQFHAALSARLYALYNEFRAAYAPEWARQRENELMYRGCDWQVAEPYLSTALSTAQNAVTVTRTQLPGAGGTLSEAVYLEQTAKRDGGQTEPQPVTPVIQSTIENIRADLADALPEAAIVADKTAYANVAEKLCAVIKENHRRCRFEREYGLMVLDLLVHGYAVLEAGFDPSASKGVGGAYLRRVDVGGVMIDPLVSNLEDARCVFVTRLYPLESIKAHYPQKANELDGAFSGAGHFSSEKGSTVFTGRIGNADVRLQDSLANGAVERGVELIECYEREYDAKTDTYSVHLTRLAGGVVLESSRDRDAGAPAGGTPAGGENTRLRGVTATGEYPFIITTLFPRRGTALGYGIVDMFKQQQLYADRLDRIILKNALMASHNKLLVTSASGFDPDDLRDWSKEVHRGDSLSGVTWFPTAPLPAYVISYAERLRASIKEESGQNEFSRGGVAAGVTAASAIAALQEMGSKRSRMIQRSVHAAFEQAVRLELEAERAGASVPRLVRMPSEEIFTSADMYAKTALGNLLPIEFSVTVKATRENRFVVAAQNELALNLVRMGMITPKIGLNMMSFDGKDEAVEKMRVIMEAASESTKGAQTAQDAGENEAKPADGRERSPYTEKNARGGNALRGNALWGRR